MQEMFEYKFQVFVCIVSQVHHKHAGIGGIQRKMEEKYRDTDQSINKVVLSYEIILYIPF